jgi:hypothetical protein
MQRIAHVQHNGARQENNNVVNLILQANKTTALKYSLEFSSSDNFQYGQ